MQIINCIIDDHEINEVHQVSLAILNTKDKALYEAENYKALFKGTNHSDEDIFYYINSEDIPKNNNGKIKAGDKYDFFEIVSLNEFVKLNDEPISIECVEDEHEEENDFKPSFWWNNRRYFLDDFVRTHNNAWTGPLSFPDHIHAYEADNYYKPLYLELVGDDAVNVYEEREVR